MRASVALLLISLNLGGLGGAEALEHQPTFEPPVDAPVSDPYRPPSSPYGPGNRGIEYDTELGQVVAAAGAGTVVFSGWVGGQQYVTVDHGQQLRTTYSWLRTRAMQRGQRVLIGTPLGTSGDMFHFGALRNGEYIDPETLFGSVSTHVALVAIDEAFSLIQRVGYAWFRPPIGSAAAMRYGRCLVVSDCIAFR
ncbi:MAG: M23 family metallopeptidase [Acidobacteria bacterium]|nr:M23 family metallopeptidase [Acidobacteriota bacterium]